MKEIDYIIAAEQKFGANPKKGLKYIDGVCLPFSPRWGLRESSLIVGGYYSGDEHEQHFLQTVGSGNWYRLK